MSLNKKLIKFRKKIRLNQKKVIDTIVKDHTAHICIFCGETENLTREHVIPQWVYGRCTKRDFITTTNGGRQTYNKTTMPACKDCNSNILGSIERQLKHEFDRVNVKEEAFSKETIELIILWLESLEYKFQILDLRRNLGIFHFSVYTFIWLRSISRHPLFCTFLMSIRLSQKMGVWFYCFCNVTHIFS